MAIALIAALDRNRLIGADGALPWRLPADMAWFRQVTWGKPLIVGRKTYESIGRPLPGRQLIVLTRDRAFRAPGCTVVHNVAAALSAAGPAEEIMIGGGRAVYEAFLPLAQRLYLTRVDAELTGDVYFPKLDWTEWERVEARPVAADDRHAYSFTMEIYERRQPAGAEPASGGE